jgi:ubiquinol-cytochrome c reductase iron-sulfur subunit
MSVFCVASAAHVCPSAASYRRPVFEQGVDVADQTATQDTAAHSADPGKSRRDFIYIATGAMGAVGVGAVVWPFINQMSPAADTLALASTEQELGGILEGQQITIFWRGKPVFVRHRSQAQIDAARADDGAALKDPQTDADRVKAGQEKWLVVEAACTHFGCVPTFGGGEFGGWLCACHGSVYDTSARIRSGPAPKNLIVPPYDFMSDTRIKIG